MKKYIFLIMLPSLLTFNLNAQSWYNKYYPDKTLSDMNPAELSFLYEKSDNIGTTGMVMSIAGVAVFGVGYSIFLTKITNDIVDWDYSGDRAYNAISFVILVGAATAIAGIPTMIVGGQRKKTILRITDDVSFNSQLQLKPFINYNNIFDQYSNGITLTITF